MDIGAVERLAGPGVDARHRPHRYDLVSGGEHVAAMESVVAPFLQDGHEHALRDGLWTTTSGFVGPSSRHAPFHVGREKAEGRRRIAAAKRIVEGFHNINRISHRKVLREQEAGRRQKGPRAGQTAIIQAPNTARISPATWG